MLAQVAEHLSHRLQLEAGIEQVLDHLELEEVTVGVGPTASGALGVGHRGAHQVGTSPIVELAVADPHDLSRAGTAVSSFRAHEGTPRLPRNHRDVVTWVAG